MSAIVTAIGIGWGITWFTYAADYSRFVSRQVSRWKLYAASTLGQFLPVVWLGVLGATLATKSGLVDPGKLIVDNYGSLAIPVLFLVIHGPIATNILNVYTFSVAAQALDVKVSRRKLSVLVGVLASVAVVAFIYSGDLAKVLDTWLIGIVAWVAAWAGVMLVHYFRFERGELDADRLFDPVGSSRLPNVNWAAMVSFVVGIFFTWMFLYGLTPALQGWAATAMGGVDLSWLAGSLAAALCYSILGRGVNARFPGHTATPNPDRAARPRGMTSTPDPDPLRPQRRRGAALDPIFAWPDSVTAAAAFTFDVDAESCLLAHDPTATRRMSLMSHQSYGPRVAVPKLLRMLERQGIRATFFVPGFTAECYPQVTRAIVDAGHEIGHHGYLHEQMQGIDRDTEARYLDRGLSALKRVADVEPTGYRAPW